MTAVFISGLSPDARDAKFLRELSQPFGRLLRTTVHKNPVTGINSEYATIEFAAAGQARNMARSMDGHTLLSSVIRVQLDPAGSSQYYTLLGSNSVFQVVSVRVPSNHQEHSRAMA